MEDSRITAFKASSGHSKAVKYIDGLIFRGLDPAVPANREFARLNKFTEAECSNQVINTIAMAIGSMSYDQSSTENSLMTGNVNFAKPELKRELETLVGQLPVGDSPRYRFVLIPLVLALRDGNTWNMNVTLLVKTQSKAGDNCYVDMSGRIYLHFRRFLEKNKFPLAVLCYPSDGAVELDYQNHVKLSYAVVGEKAIVKRWWDSTVGSIAMVTIPAFPLVGSILYATYTGYRAGTELLDCYEHGTLNPIKFPHTLFYWSKMALSIGYMISYGVQFFMSDVQTQANGAYVTIGLAALDLLIHVDCFESMALDDVTKLLFFLCFQTRQAPSLENGKRELASSQIAALCSTFAMFVKGCFNRKAFKKIVVDLARSSIQCTIGALLFFAKKLLENNISVELSEDLVIIKIGNYQLRFRNIVRLASEDISRFGELLDQWAETNGSVVNQLPSQLTELFGEKIALSLFV